MDLLDRIKNRFPQTSSVYHSIDGDNSNGILGCGFMRKPFYQNSQLNVVFDYYSGVLLLDGEGKYIDRDGPETNLYPGCFLQRIPGRMHSNIVDPDGKWLECFLCLGKGMYCALEQIGLINSKKPVLFPGRDNLLLQKFLCLFDGLRQSTAYQLPAYLTKSQEIIFLAHQLDAKNSAADAVSIIEHACRLIEATITHNLSVREIASKLEISYESFRKLFKANKGISPNEYMISKRIDTAKSMLLLPGKSISTIAYELGYCDPFSFSKQFKKVSGMSPSKFRASF